MVAARLSLEEQGRLDQKASRAIALALLPLMRPGWRVEMPRRDYHAYWAELAHDSGARISVRVGGWHNEGRVKFTPQWPTHADGRGYGTPARYTPTKWDGREWRIARQDAEDWSITCSQKRAHKAMASELARRLLPAYETMFVVAIEETRATDGHTEEAGVVAKSLAAIAGGSVVEGRYKTGEKVQIRTPGMVVSRLSVAPQFDGVRSGEPCRVDFEIHGMDPETAARVLAVIAEAEQAMLIGQTKAGTVAVTHSAGVYTITTQGGDAKVLASGKAAAVRPVLASLYQVEAAS